MTENKHAIYPPSASGRWMECPGSITLAEQLEEGLPSSYAVEGTVCHEIAADCLRKNTSPAKYLGQVIDTVEITQDLVDAIAMYVDEVHSTAVDMEVNGGKIEFTVNITPDCWGTVDAALWNASRLAVIDAKFGKGVIVQAEENSQLMIYAIGIIKTMREDKIPLPPSITLKIIQPRTVDPVREWNVSLTDLQKWAKEKLAPALDRLRNGDTACVPGEYQCRWCNVSPYCRAQAGHMMDKAAEAFAPFTQEKKPEIATGGDPLLGIREQAVLALSFKQIEDWMKSIKEHLTEVALSGEEVPFFKLVEGRSVRKWGDEEDTLVSWLEEQGIDPYEQKLKTPPAVEKEIGKKKAKELELDEHIIKPEGSPTLVPETDKRPALERNIEKQFEEFVDDDGPLIVGGVDDDEGVFPDGMSLSQRMARLAGSEEPEPEPEIATGGDPEPEPEPEHEPEIVECKESSGTATPPKAPKRKEVLDLADGSLTIDEIALEISSTENQVRMHLRYLNERDGYGYTIFKDGRVLVEA